MDDDSALFIDSCRILVPIIANKTTIPNDSSIGWSIIGKLLERKTISINSFRSVPECINALTDSRNNATDTNTTEYREHLHDISNYSRSLIVFVVLIGFVSLISVIGNLCLAKVLYSKRFRLLQTDRIVLCLALSELCLVLIDTPAEIYRFLSYSFSQEWLCRFHTFFEALFSSCIIFYHLLGAFDRFVYIHGHTSSNRSSWSKWCRRASTKSGSIILLILPIICSLPLAICNFLHANIVHTPHDNKTCFVQYTHGILIGILISCYILPLLFSFFLHAKLIYFIRTRHNHHYLTTTTAYMLPMKRNNTIEYQSKRRSNKDNINKHDRIFLQPKHSSHRRFFMTNTDTLGSTTTTTMGAVQCVPLNPNNSSNSSQSSRSSTGTSSTSITSPIVLYKLNSQANANANRTVLLLVLLLSFYVFCWAPHNIYTWHHAYQLTKPTNHLKDNLTLFKNLSQTLTKLFSNNVNADLRRIIYVNYALYLLSMISMCFSFIFYFSLNKQARHEFSRFIGCICPSIIHIDNKKRGTKYSKQVQYRTRFQKQYPLKDDRVQRSPSSIINERYKYINYPQNGTSKRTVLNYGCQIQCCP